MKPVRKPITLDRFYKEAASATHESIDALLPEGIQKEVGHFNVFGVAELFKKFKSEPVNMLYNERAFYKISLIRGKSIAEYADRVINIENNALLFATPKIPYNWIPQTPDQKGYFCIFTDEFLVQAKSGVVLDDLPIFSPGGYPVFQLSSKETEEMVRLFKKMQTEIASNYLYKYDLIRNLIMEIIHYGQKLQPLTEYNHSPHSSGRIAALFIELLERQFPIASTRQQLTMRTAKHYADRLSVHSNHLNKVLKSSTGKTTTELIAERLVREAKILLKQTDWNISEIAFSLGFQQLSHFSNFFKKQTTLSPLEVRK